jgi:hypothetical protein
MHHGPSLPSTRRLFSGSRFPLEMLSSIGFHISSLSASLLPGRSWLPGIRVGKWVLRRALAIAEVLRSRVACNRLRLYTNKVVWRYDWRYTTKQAIPMQCGVNV